MWCHRDSAPGHRQSCLCPALVLGIVVAALMLGPRQASGDTRVIPSITVSGRYDSNVFGVERSSVSADDEPSDFITTTSPSVEVVQTGRIVSGSIRAGLGGSIYVNNTRLNFFSTDGGLSLTMDGLVGRLRSGARLSVVDNVQYTPEQPAFLTPGPDEPTSDVGQIGIRAVRASSVRNSGTVRASYPIAPVVDIQGSYTHSLFRSFGEEFATQQGELRDTTTQSFTIGVRTRTRLGSVALTYHDSANESGDLSFQTRGGTLGYTRELSPTVSLNLDGGFSVVQPGSGVESAGGVLLAWSGNLRGAALRYSRGIRPSFAFESTALVSDNVGVFAHYSLTRNMNLNVNLNYASNRAIPDASVLTFQSYRASVALNYSFPRDMSAFLSYSYSKFDREQSRQVTSYDRNVATFGVMATWN